MLLIAGASGTGTPAIARAIRRELGSAWVPADDLRLALQYVGACLPDDAIADDASFSSLDRAMFPR